MNNMNNVAKNSKKSRKGSGKTRNKNTQITTKGPQKSGLGTVTVQVTDTGAPSGRKGRTRNKGGSNRAKTRTLWSAIFPSGGTCLPWPTGVLTNCIDIQDKTVININTTLLGNTLPFFAGTQMLTFADFYFNLGSLMGTYAYISARGATPGFAPTAVTAVDSAFQTSTGSVVSEYQIYGASVEWVFTYSDLYNQGNMIITRFTPRGNSFSTSNFPYYNDSTGLVINSNITTTSIPLKMGFVCPNIPQSGMPTEPTLGGSADTRSEWLHIAVVGPSSLGSTPIGKFIITQDVSLNVQPSSILSAAMRRGQERSEVILDTIGELVKQITTVGPALIGSTTQILANCETYSFPKAKNISDQWKQFERF